MRRASPLVRCLAAVCLAAVIASPGRAGEGTIAGGKLDLLVYFAYDEADVSTWEPVFTEYSKLLLNATEGGLQLGIVSFTKCDELKDRADVWILNDTSGARAHLRGLGVPGRHMTISQLHKMNVAPVLGQFGLIHETGHYVWGVYDEYKGFVGNAPQFDPVHYCVSSTGDLACVMDGGTTIVPNNRRHEFCTKGGLEFPGTGHFRGVTNGMGMAVRNDQEYYLGSSCWEQMVASGLGGLTHPNTEPVGAVPAHDDVVYDTTRLNGTLAVALVLDKSGSMSAEEKLEQMILGAQVVVGLMEDLDFLTIVAFDDTASVLLPASVVDDGVKDAALAAIAGLDAEGGTAVGRGILKAVAQLDSVLGCKEVIIVISDGVSLHPAADHSSVLNAIAGQDAVAYGIALGAFPDDASLLAMAAASGGTYFKSPTADQITGVLGSVIAQAGGGVPIAEQAGIVPAAKNVEITFDVSAFASSVRISLAYTAGANLGLVLTDPLGNAIDFDRLPPETPAYGSDVQKAVTLRAPAVGTWVASIREFEGADVFYDFLAYLESSTLDVTTFAPVDHVAWPAPMRIAVHAVAGVPAGGARVGANVERPDGSVEAIRFFDDGVDVHGDDKADDGVYSALFAAYAGDGAYRFEIDVDGIKAFAASNQECGVFGLGEEGQTFDDIEPFGAEVTRTLLLSGAPQAVRAGSVSFAEHPALAENIDVAVRSSPPTPVAGFTLSASPDEPLYLEAVTMQAFAAADELPRLIGLAVHRDLNGDGEVDLPSIPLAHGVLTPAGELTFTRGSVFVGGAAPIALLAPDAEAHFLITAGEALAATDGAPATSAATEDPRKRSKAIGGGTLFPSGSSYPPLGPGGGAALLLALLLLLRGYRSTRRGRRARRAGMAASVALALAIPACREGSESTLAPTTGPPAFELILRADGLALSGAMTSAASGVDGDEVSFPFDLR